MKKLSLVSFCSLVLLLFSAAGAQAGDWELRMISLGDSDWAAVKFHVETGECFRVTGGNWVACGEEGSDTPDGEYEVILVGVGNEWYAVRMNTETGQSWRLAAGAWYDVEEDGAESSSSSSSRPDKAEK